MGRLASERQTVLAYTEYCSTAVLTMKSAAYTYDIYLYYMVFVLPLLLYSKI